MFSLNMCCNCCGSAWGRSRLNPDFPLNHLILTRNEDWRPSMGLNEPFYKGGTQYSTSIPPWNIPTNYSSVGYTSSGNILAFYSVDQSIYEFEPYPPFTNLGVKWGSTTDIATFIANGENDVLAGDDYEESIYYHEGWGYGRSGYYLRPFFNDVIAFNSDGDELFKADETNIPGGTTGGPRNACVDKEGNLWEIFGGIFGTQRWITKNRVVQIDYDIGSTGYGGLAHTGNDLVFGAPSVGLWTYTNGVVEQLDVPAINSLNCFVQFYSEVLNRLYATCAFTKFCRISCDSNHVPQEPVLWLVNQNLNPDSGGREVHEWA